MMKNDIIEYVDKHGLDIPDFGKITIPEQREALKEHLSQIER